MYAKKIIISLCFLGVLNIQSMFLKNIFQQYSKYKKNHANKKINIKKMQKIAGFSLASISGYFFVNEIRNKLDDRASINIWTGKPYSLEDRLYQAVCNNEIGKVKRLLKRGVDINNLKHYSPPLFYAIMHGNLEMTKLFIKKGADIHYQETDTEFNALFVASGYDHKKIIELLLEKGLDINKQDKFGRTPLFWATINLKIEIVKFLIDKGADVNIKNNSEYSPLANTCDTKMRSPFLEELKLITIFLEAGADWTDKKVIDNIQKHDAMLEILDQHLAKKYHKID